MKSSHSGTPILSPAEAVVLVVVAGVDFVVAGLFVLSLAVLLLPVSVLLQPIKMAAHRTQKIRREFLNIGFAPLKRGREAPEYIKLGIEKRRYHTPEALNCQLLRDAILSSSSEKKPLVNMRHNAGR